MNAVVFKGPNKVALEKRPIPKIKDQTDIIVKVIYSALCGRLAAPQTFPGAVIELLTAHVASSMSSGFVS